MSQLEFASDGPLAVIALHNPPQNRIGDRMVADLAEIIDSIEAGESRAVLLRAGDLTSASARMS
jgi:enoyl-CoA hydratase/carnithine racemase